MTKGRAPAFLYSGDNACLWHKLQKECEKNEISIFKVADLSDFFIKRKSLGLVILFIDKSTVSPSPELMEFIQKCNEGWQSSIVVFLGDAEIELTKKYYNIMSIPIGAIDDIFMSSMLSKLESEMMRLTNMCSCKVSASRIGKVLMDFGFSPKYLGSSYLVEAIEYIILNGGIVGNLQTKSYSYVAAKFFTTTMSIERDIRMAIANAYKNDCDKFGGRKPSNKEFIAFVVNKLKYE
ncbi:MAG: sporulation initiation factor Spo0A C-terminal domain-containing protein [Christensenellaceae bacterium]|nr:sporulation initiation factor Spo0A C-terminal domain-containing protein [Christensenellaceae bacterium]